jgi:hypothetical protein
VLTLTHSAAAWIHGVCWQLSHRSKMVWPLRGSLRAGLTSATRYSTLAGTQGAGGMPRAQGVCQQRERAPDVCLPGLQACLPLMEDIMSKLDKKYGRHGRELARFLVLFAQVRNSRANLQPTATRRRYPPTRPKPAATGEVGCDASARFGRARVW